MESTASPTTLEFGVLVTTLGGGLALFLFGMRLMTASLKTAAGGRMKNLLARLTANRFTAALAGTVVTAVIQSSSVTTVLVVGFVSAGLLTLSQSVGVIIGANVGTTVTAQIIAFKVTKYALAMIALGFLVEVASRKEATKQYGMAVMGLGLIFFGMDLMSMATVPLRSWPPFIDAMQQVRHPALGILAGTLFTALVQSSSATTGVVIVLAGQGLISLEAGIALVFGANVGTCITAVLSALGKPREAMRATAVHVLFNVSGVLLWVLLIPQLADLVRLISPSAEHLEGVERLAADTPRQIANAHTLFNVVNAVIFIWFAGSMAKLAARWLPQREAPDLAPGKPLYLDDYFLGQPALALDQVRRELGRLAELAAEMVQRVLPAAAHGTDEDLVRLERLDDAVDRLHGATVSYLGKLSLRNLVEPEPSELYEYIAVAGYLENVGDVVESSIVVDLRKRLRIGVKADPTTLELLRPLHDKVCWAFDRVKVALDERDIEAARQAAESKKEVNDLAERVRAHLATRLAVETEGGLTEFQVESDLVENLKRLHTLTRRIARVLMSVAKRRTASQSPPASPNDTESVETAS
jgi:phosphate:Na+ symporter